MRVKKQMHLSKIASNESGAFQQQTAPMKMKSMRDKLINKSKDK